MNDKIPLPRMLDTLPTQRPPDLRGNFLQAIETELGRTPLDEIAARFSKLTYGEMMDLSQGIKAEPAAIWEWCIGKTASALKQST